MGILTGGRINLNSVIAEILGSSNVYYDPPASIKMKYPAIRYTIDSAKESKAENIKYSVFTRYSCILIDKNADSEIFKKLLFSPYFHFDRHYVADNLHHFVFHVWTSE